MQAFAHQLITPAAALSVMVFPCPAPAVVLVQGNRLQCPGAGFHGCHRPDPDCALPLKGSGRSGVLSAGEFRGLTADIEGLRPLFSSAANGTSSVFARPPLTRRPERSFMKPLPIAALSFSAPASAPAIKLGAAGWFVICATFSVQAGDLKWRQV